MIFYAVEITAYRAASGTFSVAEGHGTAPHGALTELATTPATTAQILASDIGYRTAPTDAGGPTPYPPIVSQAFAISRALTLDPGASTVAAAWGAVNLSDSGNAFDSFVSNWSNDGQPVRILYGTKTTENFQGPASSRATTGTYVNSSGTVQTAAAGVVRWDYSTGSAVLLNESAATNMLTFSDDFTNGAWGTGGTITRTANNATAPDGNTTADSLAMSSGSNINRPVTVTAGQTYTLSVWARVASGTLSSRLYINASVGGVVSTTMAITTTWKRFAVTRAMSATTTTATVAIDSTVGTIQVWGIQFEAGASGTSYIPTTSTTATRAADNVHYARNVFLDPAYSTLLPVFAGLSTPWFLSDTALQVPLRDATYWLERPVQTTLYLGTGGYEGTSTLAGLPKPKARGTAYNVSPVLVDPVNQIYQYSDGPGTVATLYEGAAANFTNAGDVADLYVGSTPAGQYRTSNARGMFQLGSTPVAQITADVTGAFPVAGNKTVAADIARYLLTEDLALPAANINTASFTATATAYPYAAGVYFDPTQPTDGVTAVDTVLASFGAKLYPGRDGALRVMVLRALPATATAADTFSPVNTVSIVPRALPSAINPPPYRMRVAYGHSYTVQTSGFLGAATAARKQFVAAADRYAAASSNAVQLGYVRPSDPQPVGGALVNLADAQTVANDLMSLWGTRRRLYDVTLPLSVGIVRDIGNVVSLSWPIDDLTGGKLGQVVGDAFISTDATITLTVLV